VATDSYKSKVHDFSRRIVEAQRPIRVLDSVKYRPALREAFFAGGAASLPLADSEYYQTQNPLNFDAAKKLGDLKQLGVDIKREFGDSDELGALLFKISEEYRMLVEMLMVRGQPDFYKFSKRLYGSPQDRFYGTEASVLDQSKMLETIIGPLQTKTLGADDPRTISSEDVVLQLQERFRQSFLRDRVAVEISDGIVADASAGADKIKIKQGKFFTSRDVRIFEVHEGYVHVATTLNGKSQRCAMFLSKGPPRVVSTQEGLAILMEIFTFATYPQRARSINDRVLAISMVENGADFLDVYRFQLERGYAEMEAYRNTTRVFRGGPVTGGAPFTKDISYCRGFVENYNFIRTAIRHGYPEIIPFLFVGKLHVDDVPLLYRLHKEGIVDAPELLPAQFEDLNGLAVWMSFSNFLNAVDLSAVQQHFGSLFKNSL
jgi:uncharacterized protein (TIGR02421 family)